jgi:uncharacterized protein DUF4410
MRALRTARVLWLVALAACATTDVVGRESAMEPGERLARPEHIIVYDFASTPQEVAADSDAAGAAEAPSEPPSEEQIEAGRQLGAEVAKDLVEEIADMGLPAVRAADLPQGAVGDLIIRGTFVSVDEGSAVKRIVIGFGSGGAELKTLVEGYVMTDRGLRKLGSGQIDSGGNKLPGVVLPIAVFVATANPIGLVVGGAVKATGELTGSAGIEGSGRRTAELIASELKVKFEEQGWID